MGYEVRLSVADFADAVDCASDRMRASFKAGLNHATVRNRSLATRLHNDVCGAAAELAVARWLHVHWGRTVNTFHEADVGEDIGVRHTIRHDGRLILRERDFPGHWYVLVTGTPPVMSLRGYIWGQHAQRPEFWCDPGGYGRGAWFIPQDALQGIPADGTVPPCLRQSPVAASRP
jgi:hypothetical protein